MAGRFERWRWLVPVSLLAVLVHADVLTYWFVASDSLPLIETSRIAAVTDLVELFTRPLMYGSDFVETARFYRPIASLSYALDYALWGLDPLGYHLTNLLLHGVVVALVAVAVTTLTDRTAVGVLTAVLFALHPITVEVVPVTARRQDLLFTVFALATLALFVRWYRGLDQYGETSWRERPRRALVGALLAYLLALGSKEVALVVPALLAVWVALQLGVGRPRRLLRALVGTVGPFAAVTVPYLALRTVAVGGLGGYLVATGAPPPRAAVNALFLALKYVLWLAYPLHAIERATTALSVGPLALAGLLVLAVLAGGLAVRRLVRRSHHQNRIHRLRLLSAICGVLGFVALPVVLATTPWGDSLSPGGVLGGYAVGALFVVGCIGCIAATTLGADSPLDGETRRQLVFFGCWVVVPLCALVTSGFVRSQPLKFGFGIRNGYFAAIPAMAMASLVAVPTLERARERLRTVLSDEKSVRVLADADTARLVAVLVVVLPLLATSPAIHSTRGWRAAGELNGASLGGLDAALDEVPDERFVVIAGFPNELDGEQRPYPHAWSVTPLRPYSVEAWLELHGHPERTQVRLVRKRTVAAPPADISFRAERRNGWIAVRTTTSDSAD